MKRSEEFLNNFYSSNGRHTTKTPLKKTQSDSGEFYKPVKFADLSKSLDMDTIVDPTAVLDFHMRKASEEEEDKKRNKKRGFGGGLT